MQLLKTRSLCGIDLLLNTVQTDRIHFFRGLLYAACTWGFAWNVLCNTLFLFVPKLFPGPE